MLCYAYKTISCAILSLSSKKGGRIDVDNFEVVLDYFNKADKPVSAGQIATATGIDRKEVDKIMARLKKEERIVSPKVCFWELKR